MGCVIPHQSNAVNISHQTNAGLIRDYFTRQTIEGFKDFQVKAGNLHCQMSRYPCATG